MRLFSFIGRIVSGIIAIASGIVTLIFNDVAYAIFHDLTNLQKCLCISGIILLGIFLLISTIYDAIKVFTNNLKRHRLKFQSKKFIKFFTNWYSKPGVLNIICDDLDWVQNSNNSSIYDALVKKSSNQELKLYLGKGRNSEISKKLNSFGAKVSVAPKNIIQHYTFSCLSMMGNEASRVIVRTKHEDKNGIVIFDEINNTYVTELLNTLLKTNMKG